MPPRCEYAHQSRGYGFGTAMMFTAASSFLIVPPIALQLIVTV